MSAGPDVPVGPSEARPQPAAPVALPTPTGDQPPLDCAELAARYVRERDAEMVRRAEAMMHGTTQLTQYAVPEECGDDIADAKKRPRTGELAECARTAE
ncbi:hypothetical protein [Streptomyces flavofungini]|uniref:hypothetical protein n=1 Tax=Streptomyces flavofungini TaxID=68200 RepID=UPI0034DF9643